MLNLPKIPFFAFVKIMLCLGLFAIFSFPVHAQINNNRFRVDLTSLDMGPCGGANDAHSIVEVLAKNNTVNNFEIAFDLPDGVDFIPGSETITFQQGSSDFSMTVIDMSDLNAPVFRLERPANANWQVADLVRFRFDKTASCDAVVFSYGGGLFKDAHTITYDDLNGSQSVNDTDPTINSYNFLRAYLAVLNYNNVPANVGDNVTRPVEITNSGNGNITSFMHNIVVGNSLGAYTLRFNGATLTPTTVSGNTYTYTIDLSQAPFAGNVGDGDPEFENEMVFLEESFTVLDCNDLDISHQPTWGCNPIEICQALAPVSAAVIVDSELPSINLVEINSPTNTDLCLTTTYTIRISNDATSAIAYNVEINSGFGTTSSVPTTTTANGMWGNDRPNNTKSLSNFRFGTNPSFMPPQRASTQYPTTGAGSYFISNTLFTTDPDGPGGLEDLDGDGFYDDMAPGDSTDLLYDLDHAAESPACGENYASYIQSYSVGSDAYANNQCLDYATTGREFLTNGSLARGGSSPSAPTDIFDGVGFDVGIQGILSVGGNDLPFCNGTKLFSNDPSSSWTVTLNVPTGISLDGTPAGFTQVDPNTIVYTTTDLPNVNYLNMNVDFPLIMDCGVYAGPQNVPITYTTQYECSCFAQDIQCGSVTGIRSQCPIPCDGPAITSFDAQRETAGWTDDTMTTKVVLDPNVHNVNTYMAKDEMVLRTSAVMSNTNPNSLFFELDYETLSAATGGADIIQFLNGTITINDLSSGTQTVPIDVGPVLTSVGSTSHTLTFDLSSYTIAISPTYTYGEPTVPLGAPEADEVDLELHFVFKEDFNTNAFYELNNFSGTFSDENDISCNILGDRAFYFKSLINPYDRESTSTEGCTETYIELLIQTASVPGDQFPGEYRPPSIWQSTDLEIPAGAEFTGLVTSLDFPGTDPTTTNGGLSVSQVGNVLTITPTSIQEYDQNGNHYPRIRIHFRGSSAAAPSTIVNWTSNYQEYSYSSAPVDKVDTDTHPFNFTQPNYNLTTTTPIVSGDRATALFEVDLCMDSGSTIDFNWLQINNGTDFTVINAEVFNKTTWDPLTFTESGGDTWVEAGALQGGIIGGDACKKIRFEIRYSQCANFDFIVENSWDCNNYPVDFSTANYLTPLTLRLEPKDAALQIAILNEPSGTVDICSNFNIDLELRNAGNGDLIDPVFTFDIPGDATSLTLNQIDVEYPRNSGNVQAISSNLVGNTVTLNLLDHTQIAANSGIQGSLNGPSIDHQIAIVQLDLSVQCNFVSNTAITYEARGNNPCGTPATGNGSRLSTNPIIVTGAEPTYDAISNITVPSGGLFAGCTTETITVQTTIVGGPTSSLDFARIILPDGLAFDPSSFVSNNPAYPVTYGSVTTVGNHEEFTVHMPDGANNGADPSYSFDVTPKNTSTTCSPGTRIEVNNFVVTNALTCGPVSCGTTEIANGSTFEDVIITKPQLVESTFTSNADYTTDGSGNYEYHVEFGVENTGTIDIASGFVFDVYCADGGGSKVGASIFTGTVAQSIPAGNSIIEDIIFTTNSFCGANGNMVVEFVPSNTNCHCDILSIPLVSEPEVADLEVTSSVNPVNVNSGDTVTFTIDILNNGPFEAENISIENIVPQGYTVVTINNAGTQTGNVISWPAFDLGVAGIGQLSFTATVNFPTGASNEYDNVSQVVSVDEFDSDSTPDNYNGLPLEDDEAIASVHVLTADLSLVKGLSAVSNPTPNIGDSVDFEIIVSNNGPDTANNVSIADMVPIGFTVNAASISNGGSLSGNTISWNIAAMNSGTNITLSYTAIVNPFTGTIDEYTNIAQISASDEFDPNSQPNNYNPNRALEDDESVYITAVQSADLEIINTVVPSSASPGDTILISVEISNNGPDDATNVILENLVPVGFTVTTISNSGSQSGNIIQWNNLNIPNGSNLILTYEASVNGPTNVTNEYFNTVQVVSADQYDPDSFPNNDDGDQSEDDEDNSQITLIAADLALTKGLSATSNTQPNASETVTFEITLINSGPEIATNVSIVDVVPIGYTIAAINDGGSVSGNTILWNLAALPIGSRTLSYEVTVNTPTNVADEYTNTVQITAVDQFDPDSSPNNDDGDQSEDDEASHTIASPTVDLEIMKTADKLQSFFEDTVVFTITVTNNSLYDATQVGIEDVLPGGFALVSHTTDSGVYNASVGTWEIPSIVAGATATLEMTVTITENESYTNVAELIYLDQIDDNIANDRDEVSIEITQEQCLTIFNEFSPNNDGANDVFFIECIEQYPDNLLQVFNRWGTKVFEMAGYNNTWDGTSMGRATISAPEKLPVGTYYYTLEPNDGNTPTKAGWLYISR